MRRFLISLFVLALLASGCGLIEGDSEGSTGHVSRVVDGDTIELADGRKVRYLGVNTPEQGQPFYAEAAAYNEGLVLDQDVRLEFDVDTVDKYGRILAHVFVQDLHVNLELVRQGYANVYTVPPNVRYADELLAAEREARQAQRGLWAASGVPLRLTNLDPVAEWVELSHQGGEPIDLTGYTLKDEANHIYVFDGFSLQPGESVRLYTVSGRDTAAKLYWGIDDKGVWNNDGDTAYLRAPDGALVDLFTY